MAEPQVVASRYALWKAAIKWPMYSVAVMPALLASGWLENQGLDPRWEQLGLFLLAAVLLLGKLGSRRVAMRGRPRPSVPPWYRQGECWID